MQEIVVELNRKRQELAVRCQILRRELQSLQKDIVAVDRVLSMLAPPSSEPIRVVASTKSADGLFEKGEQSILLLKVLREAGRPMTATECANGILDAKGVPANDPSRPVVASRTGALVNSLVMGRRVKRSAGPAGRLLWEIDL